MTLKTDDPWRGFAGTRGSGVLGNVLALHDFEQLAQRKLPRAIFGYVSGGVETNASRDDNGAAYREWAFVPRVLQNVAGRDLSTTLFGKTYAAPFGIAPMGIAAMSAYQGDLAMARAAAAANIPYVLSGSSLTKLETVASAAPGSWFQAYLPGTPERIAALLTRAASAGFETLMVTADVPVGGNRENNLRAGFSTPLRPSLALAWDGMTHPRWTINTLFRTLRDGMPHFENSFAQRGAPIISSNVARDFSQRDHFDWSNIDAIRAQWKGPLVIKGILSKDDALIAKQRGVDAIIVSNHGGRQLDGAIAPLRVLPEIVDTVGDFPVGIDGGILRGSDILKAIALGARFALIGRAFNYAAAIAGEAGVAHGIQLLRSEIDRNLAMLGVKTPRALSRAFVRRVSG